MGKPARKTILMLVGMLVLSALLSGCPGVTCTLIGCDSGFEVDITREDGEPFGEGIYEIIFTFGDGTEQIQTCTIASDDLGLHLECSYYDWGNHDDDGEYETLVAGVTSTPNTVTVQVELDGEVLGEHQFEPEYEAHYPNGTECGSPCFNASGKMEVDAPTP